MFHHREERIQLDCIRLTGSYVPSASEPTVLSYCCRIIDGLLASGRRKRFCWTRCNLTRPRAERTRKLQPKRILEARQQRSWTQDELAVVSGLHLRTIQRIERDGVASLQSAKALAAALDLSVQDLGTKENPMKSCPECGSHEVYRYDGEVQMYGGAEDLLPGLGGMLSSSKACPVVCGECGHLRFFIAPTSLAKMKRATQWKLME